MWVSVCICICISFPPSLHSTFPPSLPLFIPPSFPFSPSLPSYIFSFCWSPGLSPCSELCDLLIHNPSSHILPLSAGTESVLLLSLLLKAMSWLDARGKRALGGFGARNFYPLKPPHYYVLSSLQSLVSLRREET